jgi:hypothetical protein
MGRKKQDPFSDATRCGGQCRILLPATVLKPSAMAVAKCWRNGRNMMIIVVAAKNLASEN